LARLQGMGQVHPSGRRRPADISPVLPDWPGLRGQVIQRISDLLILGRSQADEQSGRGGASDLDPEHLPGQFAHVDVPVVQAQADGRRNEALQQLSRVCITTGDPRQPPRRGWLIVELSLGMASGVLREVNASRLRPRVVAKRVTQRATGPPAAPCALGARKCTGRLGRGLVASADLVRCAG
jgi:hypothetical protein